jgi:hypothetical protein
MQVAIAPDEKAQKDRYSTASKRSPFFDCPVGWVACLGKVKLEL